MDRNFAIEELLNESRWLRQLATHLVGDQADDLVQETWVASLRHPPDSNSPPRPWLARVARNLAFNSRRDESNRHAREGFAHEERPAPAPEKLAQEAEAHRFLAEAVTRLDEPLRSVVVLRYFQGLDSNRCAERLGVPASTVRTRLQRALEALRADLDARFDGGRRAWAAFLLPLALPVPGSAAASSATGLGASSSVGVLPVALAAALCAGATWWYVARESTSPSSAELGTFAPPSVAPSTDVFVAQSVDEASRAPQPDVNRHALAKPPAEELPPPSPAQGSPAALSGIVLVDGRPPEWSIELTLQSPRAVAAPPSEALLERTSAAPRSQILQPGARGAFEFSDLPLGWSGRLRVEGFAFADGSTALDVVAPSSQLLLRLVSGPAIVGRILAADGRPIPSLEAVGRYVQPPTSGSSSDEESVVTRRLRCRDDGAFRFPIPAPGVATFMLRVEEEQVGFLARDCPIPERADGLDLGTFQLEPLRALRFTVRDTSGTPIEGAFARVDGLTFRKQAPLTDAQGRGVLALVPDRPVEVRFFAFGHADRVVRVEPGSAPDVVLEPLAVIEVRTSGDASRARWVRVSAPRPAFVWDAKGWSEEAQRQLGLGHVAPFRPKPPKEGSGAAWEYKGHRVPGERFALAGVLPDVLLTVEVVDDDGRTVAGENVSVGPGGRVTLELGVAEAEAAPVDRLERPARSGRLEASAEARRRNP